MSFVWVLGSGVMIRASIQMCSVDPLRMGLVCIELLGDVIQVASDNALLTVVLHVRLAQATFLTTERISVRSRRSLIKTVSMSLC